MPSKKTTKTKAAEPTPPPPAAPATPAAPAVPTMLTAAPAPALTPAPVQQAGSKQAMVLAQLGAEQGASIAELMASTGWMSHSVRGFFSAVVRRKLGLPLTSSTNATRGRVYRVETVTAAAGAGTTANAAVDTSATNEADPTPPVAEAEPATPMTKALRSKKQQKADAPPAAEPAPELDPAPVATAALPLRVSPAAVRRVGTRTTGRRRAASCPVAPAR